MPQQYNERISSRPLTASQSGTQGPQLQVTARPVNMAVVGASQDTELDGLLDGLKSFNPALERYTEASMKRAAEEAALSGKLAGAEADLLHPADAAASRPDAISPLFGANFENSYKQTLGTRMGSQSQTNLLASYMENRKAEGFDAESFLREGISKDLQGVTDPTIRLEMAKHHEEAAKMVREDYRKLQFKAVEDSAKSSVMATMGSNLTADMTPEALYRSFQERVVPVALGTKVYTRPEMAEMFVRKIEEMSVNAGGAPELFDSLTSFKDPTNGKTIADTSPELSLHIATAKKQAEKARKVTIEQEKQAEYFKMQTQMEARLSEGLPYSVSEIAALTGPENLFKTDNEALAFWHRQNKLTETKQLTAGDIEMLSTGRGAFVPTEERQKAAAAALLGPEIEFAKSNILDPAKADQVQMAFKSIADKMSKFGAKVPVPQLKEAFAGIASAVPEKNAEPTQQFQQMAELYRQMPPHLRSLHTDEDTQRVLDSYVQSTSQGNDKKTAYQTSYQQITPAAKEAEKLMSKDPNFLTELTKGSRGAAMHGWSWAWRSAANMVPFVNTRPDNEGAVAIAAEAATKQYIREHPNVYGNMDKAKAFAEQWTSERFVHDTVSNMLVEVPPRQASEGAQAAIEGFMKEASKKYPNEAPYLVHLQNGQYQLRSGASNDAVLDSSVTFNGMMKSHVEKTTLTPQDMKALSDLNIKLVKGQATVQDVSALSPLITKAQSVGALNENLKGRVDAVMKDEFMKKFNAMPRFSLGAGGNSLGPVPASKNDRKAQAEVTGRFTESYNLAGALITQGEGIVLTASPDPARGAGYNIGAGYNLKANEKNLAEDFRRAGIPYDPASIEGIKSGRSAISTDQAKRLLEVTLPRYEKLAQDGVTQVSPGLWEKLTKPQRAVITDVAYQVGDVSQFKESIKALLSTDQEKINKAFQVTYVNDRGERVPDTRRNTLRANMLNGLVHFKAVTAAEGRKPMDKLAALTGAS